MGYTLKVLIQTDVKGGVHSMTGGDGMPCEIIYRERDLLDEIFAELALIVTTHGRKGIRAIIIMKDEDKIVPL